MNHYIYEQFTVDGSKNVNINYSADLYISNTFIQSTPDLEENITTIKYETDLKRDEHQHIFNWFYIPQQIELSGVTYETFPIIEEYTEDGETIQNIIYNCIYDVKDLNSKPTGEPIFVPIIN